MKNPKVTAQEKKREEIWKRSNLRVKGQGAVLQNSVFWAWQDCFTHELIIAVAALPRPVKYSKLVNISSQREEGFVKAHS